MKIFSQRDAKWASNLMGTGTLGQLGCTVTCLSMLSEISPDVLNNEIKQVSGYSGNYIIWEKLDSIKGFDFIKRVGAYDNADVSANLPCLVEVNGAPIGGTTHWVLYIGNQKLWDPWTGTEKATSSYTPIGYAVVKYNQLPEPCVLTDQTLLPIFDEKGHQMELQAVRSRLSDQEQQITNLLTDKDSLTFTVTALNQRITQLESEIANQPPDVSGGLLKTLHDVIWGKGFWFIKWARIKALLPK